MRWQFFHATLANPLAPFGHAGRVNPQFMFEKLNAVQILPIRIFHPSTHNLFLAEVAGVFDIVQGNYQATTDCRPAIVRTLRFAKDFFEFLLFHSLGQFDQRRLRIDRVHPF
jgi:hypothetical protein